MSYKRILLTFGLLLIGFAAWASADSTSDAEIVKDSTFSTIKSEKSITEGNVVVNGNRIDYEAHAGILVLRNEKQKPTIAMSYVAYFKKGERDLAKRPLTFVYNGGPGSSSSWLHMASWGPKIFDIQDLTLEKAPFKVKNNEYSLLDASDLVFIDAPGTGFGEIITEEQGGAGKRTDFFGTDEDGKAFADFIAKFISTYNRWNSPKYLFGESYGTLRSPVIAQFLQTKSISLNGMIQLSQLLNYTNASRAVPENPGADLNFQLMLPTYAATAYYHKKTAHQEMAIEAFIEEVEKFTLGEYAGALSKGVLLEESAKRQVAEKLHGYIGLPVNLIMKANLRIKQPQFTQNLLADSDKITGRLDTRFVGDPFNPMSENADYDPMISHTGFALSAAVNMHLRTELKYGENKEYKIRGNVRPWNYTRKGEFGFPNVMGDLARVMIYNPNMKVMVNSGYYDLSTPFFQGKYEMSHLEIPKHIYDNIEFQFYEAGHMMYLHPESFKVLHDKVADFIKRSH